MEYERPIGINSDDYSTLGISDAPMGRGRDDRSVVVGDPTAEKRTSNIMLGYNKDGIMLDNGVLVSWEEVREAIKRQAEDIGENERLVCVSTGKTISSEKMVDEIYKRVLEAHSSVVLNPNSKITNQDAKSISIREAGSRPKAIPKGVLMLGNGGVQLPCGEYLSLEEIEAALQDYAIKGKTEETNEKHSVLYRFKSDKVAPAILSAIFAITMILAMIGIDVNDEKFVDYYNEIMYKIGYTQQVESPLTEDQIIYLIAEDIKTGDKIMVPSGVTYWESSDYDYGGRDNNGVFMDGRVREPGEYTSEYISVLYAGKIQDVEYAPGVELKEVIEKESQRLNCSPSELRVMLHIGNKVSGWVDLEDLINGYENEGFSPTIYTEKKQTLEGKTEFTPTIKIDNGTGKEVELRVVDDEGTLLEPGSIVIGSDGLEYEIENLALEQQEIVTDLGQKKTVTFSIKNISPEEALALAAIAAAAILSAKKRKEYTEMTEEEIVNLVANTERARREYEESSEMSEALNDMSNLPESRLQFDRTVRRIESGNVPIKDYMEDRGVENVPPTAKDFDGSEFRENITSPSTGGVKL